MAKKEIKDVASSVKARLTARAKEQREDVQSVLVRYGVERFLYRLSISENKNSFLQIVDPFSDRFADSSS